MSGPTTSAGTATRLGGWSLIMAAVSFMAVFGYLAATFDYPDVLDGNGLQVLPRLLALGPMGRAVWALYGLLPLLLVPAGLGVYAALRDRAPSHGRAAMTFAILSAVSMAAGLLRWPSIHWALAGHLASATDPGARTAIVALFDALNAYLGQYIGEFVGELTLNLFFLCTAQGMVRAGSFPRWAGPAGTVAALAGLIGMWRNVTPAVAVVAELENYVLPLWLVMLGVLLVRARVPAAAMARGDDVRPRLTSSVVAGLVVLLGVTGDARRLTAQEVTEGGARVTGLVVVGVGVVPEYPGAKSLEAIPFVGGRVEKGRRYLQVEGITARLNVLGSRHLEFGPVLNLTFGRDSSEATGPVAGLPARDLSIEAGGFVAVSWGTVLRPGDEMRVMVQAARGVNGVHTGWLGAVSLGYGLPLTTRLHLAARAAVELASDAFVDTYFGVPPANAVSSGLPPTVASGGVLGVGASINVLYAFTPRWAVNGAFGYRRLLGDAASSPVTVAAGSPNQVVAALGVGYLF